MYPITSHTVHRGLCVISLFYFPQACAGLLADARAIVDVARIEASNYRAEYGMPIPCMVSLCIYWCWCARWKEEIDLKFCQVMRWGWMLGRIRQSRNQYGWIYACGYFEDSFTYILYLCIGNLFMNEYTVWDGKGFTLDLYELLTSFKEILDKLDLCNCSLTLDITALSRTSEHLPPCLHPLLCCATLWLLCNDWCLWQGWTTAVSHRSSWHV